ncbi:MAG: adenine-specific methyltransferase EcoRI family protein [Candidatus Saccharimonadales bacterium]
MANTNLTSAKRAKNDEFYTQFTDIQKEIEAYLEYDPDTFHGKVVYCNCDDPFESNFFRYFVLNFKRLGLKRLITTSYKPSPVANTQLSLFGTDVTLPPAKGRPKVTANKFVISDVGDINGDGSFTLADIAEQLKANQHNEWHPLAGDGDFRSPECIELLKQSDIVVTNPPFSLFREYVAQLVEYGKKFLIIGNMNLLSKKEIFPLIKDNKMWFGPSITSGDREFQVPETYPLQASGWRVDDKGNKFIRVKGVRWYTNLDHGRRHQPLSLMSMADNRKYNKKIIKDKYSYVQYVNYDAIEVPFTDAIPSDYVGAMGVPITFIDKYNPDQFEIIGVSLRLGKSMSDIAPKGSYQQGGPSFYADNGDGTYKRLYDRIIIMHKGLKLD